MKNFNHIRSRFACYSCFIFIALVTLSATKSFATTFSSETSNLASSQQKRIVEFRVVDEADVPIVGAVLYLKNNTNISTVTDSYGVAELNIPKNSVVMVTFFGNAPCEVQTESKTEIVVKMVPESVAVEEVVVVAYGNQTKASVVGAISNLDVNELNVTGASISSVLAGQLSGVVAMNRSGEPGRASSAEFYIRGVASFAGSNEPLVLVDGIERELDLVDVEDIASFSILKDASASAVYGVRGANGVILINTKKGVSGKPEINVRFESGITQPTMLPTMVDAAQWAELYNEMTGTQYYSQDEIQMYKDGTDPDLYPNVNWMDELYNDFAQNQRLNINVSGGNKVSRYYVSGGLYNENSMFKNAEDIYDYNSSIRYTKFSFRANMDFNVTNTTVLNVNLSNIYESSFGPGSSTDYIWSQTFQTSPNAYPVQYSDGTLSSPSIQGGDNPYNLLVHTGYTEYAQNSAQSLIGIDQDLEAITPGLKANVKFSWDAVNSNTQVRSKTMNQYHASGRDEDGNLIYGSPIRTGEDQLSFSESGAGSTTTYLEGNINYNRVFDDVHRVSGLLLYNHKIQYIKFTSSDGALPYKNQGLAARATYSYKDKYFAEFNMGYNGSENFASGHRFGFFPAYAAGWMLSEEKFWEPLKEIVNSFKIKGSYGTVGNDGIGGSRWIYQSTITSSGGWYYGESASQGGSGLIMGNVENLDVSWEEAIKTNIGFEMMLFNSLRIQADYFDELRTGVFITRQSVPDLVGLSTMPQTNIGKSRSSGFDGSAEFNKSFGDFYVTARANFTYSRNELLDNDEVEMPYAYQNSVGKTFDTYGGHTYGLVAIGFFEDQADIDNSPVQSFGTYRVGDTKYLDINGDGVVDTNDEIAIGYTSIPEIVYGFGATAQWKGIDVNLFFQGVARTTFWTGGYAMQPFSTGSTEQSAINADIYYNGWSSTNTAEENSVAKYPRLSIAGGAGSSNNNRTSTLNMVDGSFLRLKNVEIGYSLPSSILKDIFINKARIYVSGSNLLTFSDFDLWDPELGSSDGSVYPTLKVVTIGLNISF